MKKIIRNITCIIMTLILCLSFVMININAQNNNEIFLNTISGNDNNDGKSINSAVKTLDKAYSIAGENDEINVIGSITINDTQIWDYSQKKALKLVRHKDNTNSEIIKITSNGKLTLQNNIIIDGKNIGSSYSLIETSGELTLNKGVVITNGNRNGSGGYQLGGAINVRAGKLLVDGASLTNNKAQLGGAISALYNSKVIIKSGEISNNEAIKLSNSKVQESAGGGIFLGYEADLLIEGGEIKNNKSVYFGGGISLGSQANAVWVNSPNKGKGPSFTMNGGVIEGNSADSTGGGILIQSNSKGTINGGKIINNKALNKYGSSYYAGGGIYVNSSVYSYLSDGTLYLTNVAIYNNTAERYGGGIASCPSSYLESNYKVGSVIFENKANGNISNGGNSDVYVDKSYGAMGTRGQRYTPEAYISQYMLNGAYYKWLDPSTHKYLTNEDLEGSKNIKARNDYTSSDEDIKQSLAMSKVTIANNYSASAGGGIGSNGTVIIGQNDDYVNVNIEKTWEDNQNENNTRPKEITFTLYRDNQKTNQSITISSNETKASFNKLPKYNYTNGEKKEFKYTIKEEKVIDYQTSYNDEANENGNITYKVTNTYQPEIINIEGEKTWNDDNNRDGIRPKTINVELYANDKKIDEKVVSSDTNWKYSFNKLRKYDGENEIKYSIKEVNVDGYESKVNGYNIENTHRIEKINITGIKLWEDNDNKSGQRPEEVTINLLANGKIIQSQKVSLSDGWAYSFNDLPKYENGQIIKYTVMEDKVKNYIASYNGFNITNTLVPENEDNIINIYGKKIWKDENNKYHTRAKEITVKLLADNKVISKIKVSKATNWKYSFENLPKYIDNKQIIYTIEEENVKNYKTEINGYNITNTLINKKKVVKTGDFTSNIYGYIMFMALIIMVSIKFIKYKNISLK